MILGLIIILVLYASVFAAGEMLHRKGYAAKTTRKITHMGSGIVSFFLPLLVNLQTVVIIGSCFVLLLFWTAKKQFLSSVHRVENKSFGAILFPIGLTLCAIIFWNINPLIFQGAALILGLSDGLACIFGQKFGRRGYNISGYKTLEGSLMFFLITSIILLSIIFWGKADIGLAEVFFVVLGALALSIVEGLSGRGWDNLFIPLFGGLTIYLILSV